MDSVVVSSQSARLRGEKSDHPQDELAQVQARRTAFVARFIVMREAKRSRAHRIIEMLEWTESTTAEQLADTFRKIFKDNGDNMGPVERDVRRALGHANRSLNHFIQEYAGRATVTFIDSLWDYERSNALLFGHDERPKVGGWRLPKELSKQREETQKGGTPKDFNP